MPPDPPSMRRRAKPLLGTLVSIEGDTDSDAAFLAATDAAFARIAAIHAAMSFHEAGSDLRALARANPGDVLTLSPDTRAVLRMSLDLERGSGAVFNVCCAGPLVALGRLPCPADAGEPQAACLEESLEWIEDGSVRIRRRPWIDLGGIAKGHAVDAAVDALVAAGIRSGCVNAGGDLRVFGNRRETIHLRDPRDGGRLMPIAEIAEAACATTAVDPAAASPSHLVGKQPRDAPLAVAVFAPNCAIADALTKVVWLDCARAAALLARMSAEAIVLDAAGLAIRIDDRRPSPA